MLAILALAAIAAAPEPALPRPQLVVRVVVEHRANLRPDLVARVVATAAEVWRPYADITFSTPSQPATAFRREDELTLVITDRTLPNRDAGSLGWIEFVNGRPERTITVSVTAARTVMAGASWMGRPLAALPTAVADAFLAGALGRGAAHEIGHYLLRSREHTRQGLMRARFTAADVFEKRRGSDALAAPQLAAIHRHLLELAAVAEDDAAVW